MAIESIEAADLTTPGLEIEAIVDQDVSVIR